VDDDDESPCLSSPDGFLNFLRGGNGGNVDGGCAPEDKEEDDDDDPEEDGTDCDPGTEEEDHIACTRLREALFFCHFVPRTLFSGSLSLKHIASFVTFNNYCP
jgi:hypothetical protein